MVCQVVEKSVETECKVRGEAVENESGSMEESSNHYIVTESTEAIRESSSHLQDSEDLSTEVINLKVN